MEYVHSCHHKKSLVWNEIPSRSALSVPFHFTRTKETMTFKLFISEDKVT